LRELLGAEDIISIPSLLGNKLMIEVAVLGVVYHSSSERQDRNFWEQEISNLEGLFIKWECLNFESMNDLEMLESI